MKFSNRKWRMNNEDSTFSLCFEYAWLTQHEWFNIFNKLYAAPKLKDFNYNNINMLKSDARLKTDSEFLDFVFKFSKEGVYIMGWYTENIYFIYPNESLEEIKVKMDLEDV